MIINLSEEQIEHMVNRFLSWKLPKTFSPDCGIKFEPIINAGTDGEHCYEPIGTNVFNYVEAEEMIRFMISIPRAEQKPWRTKEEENDYSDEQKGGE